MAIAKADVKRLHIPDKSYAMGYVLAPYIITYIVCALVSNLEFIDLGSQEPHDE